MEDALGTVQDFIGVRRLILHMAWHEGHCVKTNAFAFCCNKACLRLSGNQENVLQPRRSSPAPLANR
jgi:hypothetical protein